MTNPGDQSRLEALSRYEILDTFPEASFDRLTRLVANIFETPIALISLLDATRQWFKSSVGVDATETPLELSFCRYTVESDDVMVVPDTMKDERFSGHPFVTGEPGVRFYAGAPLRAANGSRIGTLCVVDTIPRRPLESSEKQILTDLAAVVVDELELRLATRNAKRSTSAEGGM